MDNNKISFSINGDPTRGYKNVAFRGLLTFTSQAYLVSNPTLTDGGDTYICYITDKVYEIHIVTSSSKVGGYESRGAFNVGIAVPKGFEVRTIDGRPVTISELTRALRDKFAEIAMTPNKEGRFLYDSRSLDAPVLNKALSEWLDQEFRLIPVSRKEIVMKGSPNMESRAKIRVPSIQKIDEFFSDPHFSQLQDFGSVEVVCSNIPDSMNLDIPRKKRFDLSLFYKKNNAVIGRKDFPAFFTSEYSSVELPIGKGLTIEKYEKFEPQKGTRTSLDQLRKNNDPRFAVDIDNVNEVVKMEVKIEPRSYEIEINWEAVDKEGKACKLTDAEIYDLAKDISFKSEIIKKSIVFDESKKKWVLRMKGADIDKIWRPEMKDNDTWYLDKRSQKSFSFNPDNSVDLITLTLHKLKKEITLQLQFFKGNTKLAPDTSRKLINALKIECVSNRNGVVEKPSIDVTAGTITFNSRNIKEEWRYSSTTEKYKVFAQGKIEKEDIESKILRLEAEPIVSRSDQNERFSPGRSSNNSEPSYTVVVKVTSGKLLPKNSQVVLRVSRTGKSEKIPLALTNKEGDPKKVYKYYGKKAIDPSFKDADQVIVNEQEIKENRYTSDRGYPIETLSINLVGNASKFIRRGVPILILLIIGFLIGAVSQRFGNLPFPDKSKEGNVVTVDSLKKANQQLKTNNDSLTNVINSLSKETNEEPQVEQNVPAPITEETTEKPAAAQKDPYEIRNKIMAELKNINTNEKANVIAQQARDIVNKYINEPNLDPTAKKWFTRNIINDNDDSRVAGSVRSIANDKLNPFK